MTVTVFNFKAVAADGQIIESQIEAADRSVAIQEVRSRGQLPIRIHPARPKLEFRLSGLNMRKGLSQLALGRFIFELGTVLQAGMPMDRALQLMAEVADRGRSRRLAEALAARVHAGKPLAEAITVLNEQMPREYVGMITAGESGATLETVLLGLGELIERRMSLRARIAASLIYPAILMAMAALSVVVMLAFVLPSFAPIFAEMGTKLPLPTRAVMAIGEATQDYGAAALVLALSALLLFSVSARSSRGRHRLHGMLLKLPILGRTVTLIEVAKLGRLLGTLLRNGVTLTTALELSREATANMAMSQALTKVSTAVRAGRGLAASAQDTGLFPTVAIRLIQVGEESGHLESMLMKLADIYETESERAIQRMLSMLTPVLTLLLGAVVAFIISSILLALLSVNDLAAQ
jgi:general secretion pathway protein F